MIYKGDFRASGSSEFYYEKELFNKHCVHLVFEVNKKINSQCIAYDFVFDKDNNLLIVEISYGFTPFGYWDEQRNWHKGKFHPEDWMVESIIKEVKKNE